jgi:hypothetical protein
MAMENWQLRISPLDAKQSQAANAQPMFKLQIKSNLQFYIIYYHIFLPKWILTNNIKPNIAKYQH